MNIKQRVKDAIHVLLENKIAIVKDLDWSNEPVELKEK